MAFQYQPPPHLFFAGETFLIKDVVTNEAPIREPETDRCLNLPRVIHADGIDCHGVRVRIYFDFYSKPCAVAWFNALGRIVRKMTITPDTPANPQPSPAPE